MKAEERELLRFLEGTDKNFIIPIYQRNYDWKKENCKQLFNDLENAISKKLSTHFFGSIVCKPEDLERIIIIDGQQRITTVSLLLLAIYNNIKNNNIEVQEQLDEKILNDIIKPKDKLIEKLYQDNVALHKELSKQAKTIEEAEKYQSERDKIIADNKELNNSVKILEKEYKKKSDSLDLRFNNRKDELEKEFKYKTYDIENQYKSKIRKLEKENNYLNKIINKFWETLDKFIHWICEKFDIAEEDNLIRDFQKETNTFIDPEKQIKNEEREKEWDLER